MSTQRSVFDEVQELVQQHSLTWRGRSQWFWLRKLFLEVCELAMALAGLPKDSPDHELKQIAAIAINWLRYRRSLE